MRQGKRMGIGLLAFVLVAGLLTRPLTAVAVDIKLTVGEAKTISAQSSSSPYSWSSSSPQVASVSDTTGQYCTITGRKAGTATISVYYQKIEYSASATDRWGNVVGGYVTRDKTESWSVSVTDSGGTTVTPGPADIKPPVVLGTVGENVAGTLTSIGDYSPAADLAPAKRDGLWGYVDSNLNLAIPFQFDEATPFLYNAANQKYARVAVGVNRYVIDTSGTFVITEPHQLYEIHGDYIRGYWVDSLGRETGENIQYYRGGWEITKSAYAAGAEERKAVELAEAAKGGMVRFRGRDNDRNWQFYAYEGDYNETVFVMPRPEGFDWPYSGKPTTTGFPLREDVMVVEKDGKYGLLDRNGRLVIPCVYDKLGDSWGGWLTYQKGSEWGLLENPVNPPETNTKPVPTPTPKPTPTPTPKPTPTPAPSSGFQVGNNVGAAIDYREKYNGCGLYAVKIGDLWGFVDKNDILRIPLKFDRAFWFDEGSGMAVVRLSDGRENVIDLQGNLILKENYDEVISPSRLAIKASNGEGDQKVDYYFDAQGNPISYEAYLHAPKRSEQPTPTPTPAPAPSTAFSDVPAGSWCEAPVAWAVENGITAGTGKGKFSPNQTCTEAEILTFLWRAAGKPDPEDKGSLLYATWKSLYQNAFYLDAALWASENGLLDGDMDDVTDLAATPCTRASTVVYLWTMSGCPTAGVPSFSDVYAGDSYAQAVDWAVRQGITTGTGSGDTFSPQNTCTRGEIVTFLYRAFRDK